jgi:uncharacterized membrane-anchored protein
MPLLPEDHPQRAALAEEFHARQAAALDSPLRASFVAVVVDPEERPREFAHLVALCRQVGIDAPLDGATQFSAQLGQVRLQWERHAEFSSLTVYAPGLSPQPFSEPASGMLPPGWLANMPGRTLVAAHAKLVPWGAEAPAAAVLAQHFDGNLVVGAAVADGAGYAFTDFRVHLDGYARFLVCNRAFTPRQAGRTLQRLFEIEAYRMMALLALPIARQQLPRTIAAARSLVELVDRIAGGQDDDDALLQELTRLAASVERELAASQQRYSACRAYERIVATRVAELRESRLPGIQTIEEFMTRRFAPGVATCANVAQRLHELSERVAQASGLLSTRVDIARERQNQALLASMDKRAKLQLRLQQTVEGLSVAAIVYYVAGLVGYLAKGAKAAGLGISPDLLVGVALPFIGFFVVLALRRAHKALHRDE